MKAIVIYESLWGNTAAIAQAIAASLGSDVQVLSTAEASNKAIAGADLIIAGAPVHTLSLPTDESRELARDGGLGPGEAPPDLSHPKMRTWLKELPKAHGYSAAFDTRVKAWYGRGSASKILKGLKNAGYIPISKPQGFFVSGHPLKPTTDGTLCDGEIERAQLWGIELANAMA